MDYSQEQEMEIEALQAILMDDIQELSADGIHSQRPSYQIKISLEEDEDESSTSPAQVALVFVHTPNYPEEPPLLDVRSIKGVRDSEAKELKEKLHTEALNNLGMAMMYTLVTSAKEWLLEKYSQKEDSVAGANAAVAGVDEVEPHGELVSVDTFLAWREGFEAEIALEKARLMPDSALSTSKEKRLTGRAWFESGRAAAMKAGKAAVVSSDEEADEEVDLDVEYDDGDLDEDDMLEHYLSQKA